MLRRQSPISRGKKQRERAVLRKSTRWLLGLGLTLVLATRVMVEAGPAAPATHAQQPPCPVEVITAFHKYFPPADDQGAPFTASATPESARTFLAEARVADHSKRDAFVKSFDGPISARIVEPGEKFLRYAPAATGQGSFFTKSRFDSPAEAWSALALRHSPGNDARFRQTVTVLRCTIVLEGGIRDGRAGVSQTLAPTQDAFAFGVGVSYDRSGSMTATAYLSAAAVLVVLWLLYRVLTGYWNPFRLIEGADGRPSTSKFQFFLWTVVVVFSYTAVYAARVSKDHFEAIDDIPKNVLIAMGLRARLESLRGS